MYNLWDIRKPSRFNHGGPCLPLALHMIFILFFCPINIKLEMFLFLETRSVPHRNRILPRIKPLHYSAVALQSNWLVKTKPAQPCMLICGLHLQGWGGINCYSIRRRQRECGSCGSIKRKEAE